MAKNNGTQTWRGAPAVTDALRVYHINLNMAEVLAAAQAAAGDTTYLLASGTSLDPDIAGLRFFETASNHNGVSVFADSTTGAYTIKWDGTDTWTLTNGTATWTRTDAARAGEYTAGTGATNNVTLTETDVVALEEGDHLEIFRGEPGDVIIGGGVRVITQGTAGADYDIGIGGTGNTILADGQADAAVGTWTALVPDVGGVNISGDTVDLSCQTGTPISAGAYIISLVILNSAMSGTFR